jgi:hypothetical protein
MVVACISLCFAVGGTSYAAVKLPRNSVGAAQLKSNSVTSAKIKNGQLKEADFARGVLDAGPQGPAGPAGPTGARGADGSNGTNGKDGLLGTVVVQRTDVTLPDPPGAPGVHGAWASGFATCGAGEKIIGGSVNVSAANQAEVHISRPSLDGTGGGVPTDNQQFSHWKGTARALAGNTGETMRVFAICVKTP